MSVLNAMKIGFVRWMVLLMEASLEVTLAKIWTKSFDYQIKSTKEIMNMTPKARTYCITYHMNVIDNLR